MLNRTITHLLAGAAVAFGVTAAQAKDLAFSVFVPAASPTVSAVYQPWIDWFNEKAAPHDVSIKLYAGGTLGRSPLAQAQMVADGVADMALTVPSYTPGVYPDFDMFELPGFIGNVKEGSLAALELHQEGKLSGYEDYYVVAIYTSDTYMLHSKPEIKSFDDIAGKRFRVAGQIQTAVVEALGGVPQNASAGEMAEAIDRGLLDGALTDASVARTFRVSDVATNHYAAKLGVLVFTIVMNRGVYEDLPAEVQDLLAQSGQIVADNQIASYGPAVARNLEQWESSDEHTVVQPSEEDSARIDEAVAPVIDRVAAAATPGLLEAFKSKLEEIRTR
ncbi:TRAP transporter substrate-binding protein [Hoeflea alexandrii]